MVIKVVIVEVIKVVRVVLIELGNHLLFRKVESLLPIINFYPSPYKLKLLPIY